MHIVVTADVHLDAGRWGRTNPITGRNTAWESAERCWHAACDHTIASGADALVVAGDAFLHGRPSPEALESFADGLRRVANHAGIPCVIIGGNHEWIGVPTWHRSCLARFTDINGVHVVLDPGITRIGDLPAIATLPWPRRATLATELGLDRLSPADSDLEIGAWLDNKLADLAAQVADEPSILLGHATVGEASLGSDRRGSELIVHQVFSEPCVPLDTLTGGPWSLVELGHIHRRQHIDPERKVAYTGSPDRVDFGEEGQTKGFTVITIDAGGGAQRSFLPTPARSFITVRVDRPDPAIDHIEPGALVRLIIADTSVDHAPLRRALTERGCEVVNVITPTVTATARTDTVTVGEDVTVIDGLELWLTREQIEPELATRVRTLAAELTATENPDAP